MRFGVTDYKSDVKILNSKIVDSAPVHKNFEKITKFIFYESRVSIVFINLIKH